LCLLLAAPKGHYPSVRAEENTRADDERIPWAKRRSEQRKRDPALRYEPEMESRKVGWGDPALVYDEEKELFRFRDGRLAFSRDHADWDLLRKRGRMKGL
jgi:hypothetical protein